MGETGNTEEEFAAAFEAAFARFQVGVEEACAAPPEWPAAIAAAIRAGFEFAAADPAAASLLTREALAAGPDGIARHLRLIAYVAEGLAPGREQRSEAVSLPSLTERALAGGLLALVAERLERKRLSELPALVPQAVEFALTPYLGAAEASRIAASG